MLRELALMISDGLMHTCMYPSLQKIDTDFLRREIARRKEAGEVPEKVSVKDIPLILLISELASREAA